MANKLYLDNNDYDAPYEPSESEDEYSEEEKEILKEIRQRNDKKPDPKREILAFDDNSDDGNAEDDEEDDIIGDSDIERGDEDDGIPDSKAWGKQRRAYYNTDFVDQDYSAYNEQEEEQAQQEEEEAKAIQLRLAKELEEADFFLDLPADAAQTDEDEEEAPKEEEEDQIKLKSDLRGLSEREKQQLFKKDSPEFAGLVSDFQTQLIESQKLLDPILEFAKERNLQLPAFQFAETRNNLILTYCTNVAAYLLLKAKRIPIKYHPVIKRLAQLKKLLNQLDEKYESVVKPELEKLLEKINAGEEIEILEKPLEKKPAKKLRMMKSYTEDEEQSEEEEEGEEDSFQQPCKASDASSDDEEGAEEEGEEDEEGEGDEEGEEAAERRGITYQIAKNKGLTAHRKKELRNPRVKHRSKFRKALIRRKGAVRTVRKETQRYGGEISGIKATVKKGIKIKS